MAKQKSLVFVYLLIKVFTFFCRYPLYPKLSQASVCIMQTTPTKSNQNFHCRNLFLLLFKRKELLIEKNKVIKKQAHKENRNYF